MEYLHVKNLEKYQPGYTDRTLIWAKIYLQMLDDEAFELLCEIDRYRFLSLILYELRIKRPVPMLKKHQLAMGWNVKKRAIPLTIQMLHTFTDCVTEPLQAFEKPCTVDKNRIEQNREDKIRKDKTREEPVILPPELKTPEFESAWDAWLLFLKERGRGKAIPPSTLSRHLSKLARAGPAMAVKMIEQSIERNWQGLFEVKDYDTNRQTASPSNGKRKTKASTDGSQVDWEAEERKAEAENHV